MKEVKDKHKIKIIDLLRAHPEGLTISEIMKKTKLARHTVLARLHHLEGQRKLTVRQINMAKLHQWKQEDEEEEDKSKTKHKHHRDVKVRRLKEEHIKEVHKKEKKESKIDLKKIKREIEEELRIGNISKEEAQIKEQREPISNKIKQSKDKSKKLEKKYIKTGVPGFDELLVNGIPEGSAILVAGGAGSGKTIFSLETVNYQSLQGKKCLYMSFEESEEKLTQHMEDFGWDVKSLIKKGNLMIKRFNPFDITRNVDALLMKAKGELLIDVEPIIFPEGFKPEIIVVDSLTAIASAFVEKEDSYRVYIDQLFRFFEKIRATSFLITETKQIPTVFSQTGVEEFLADGVIVLYNVKRGNIRENAIEVLKLRGADHEKRIVAFEITNSGIIVYPEQEVFGGIEES